MTLKTARPSDQKFLGYFYELADFDAKKRVKAAEQILSYEDLEQFKDYVLERLVKGLVSGKTAARFGFSMVLPVLLQKFEDVTPESLFKLIEKELPYEQEKSSDNLIGRHFAYLAIENSGKFEDSLSTLIIKHLELAEAGPFLNLAVVDAISVKALGLTEAKFKKYVANPIKKYVGVPLSEISLEGLILLVRLQAKFGKVLKAISPSFSANQIAIKVSDLDRIVELLKTVEQSSRNGLCIQLLKFGEEIGQFEAFYRTIVDVFVLEGDENKTSERYFILHKQIFADKEFNKDQILFFFSKNFITFCRKYSHRSDPLYKGHQELIAEALESFKSRVEEFSSSEVLNLIELIDSVEKGDFDSKVGLPSRLTEFLVSKLNQQDFEAFAQKSVKEANWSSKRIVPSFASATLEAKKGILQAFANVSTKPQGFFNVSCALLEQLFKILPKKNNQVVISETDSQALLEVTKTKIKGVKEHNKSFEIVCAALKFLNKTAESDEDAVKYLNESKEVHDLAQNFDGTQFVDLTLSIISRVNRVHKALAYYLISNVAKRFDENDVQFIIEIIAEGNNNDESDDESESGDFKPITEEERKQVQEKWAKEAEEAEVSDNEEEDIEVDEALVNDMKKALGKFAVNESDDEDMEIDDKEIAGLDEALGEALRKHTKKGKKEETENLTLFRAKAFDLLAIILSNISAEVLIKSLAPLSELIVHFDSPDHQTLLPKVEHVIGVIHDRKKEKVEVKVVKTVWIHINSEVSTNTRSVKGRRLVSDLFVILLSYSSDHTKQKADSEVSKLVLEMANSYLSTEESDVKTAQKEALNSILFRYSQYLAVIFSDLANLLKKTPLEKQTEIVRLLTFGCRKDVFQGENTAVGNAFVKQIAGHVDALISSSAELKHQAVAKWIIFIYRLVYASSVDQIDVLKNTKINELLNSEEFTQKVLKCGRDIQQEVNVKPSLCLQRIRNAFN